MWTRITLYAAAVMAAALFTYFGERLIVAYGVAREAKGVAEGKLAQLPAILSARTQAERASLAFRDRLVTAEWRHDATIARMLPLLLSAQDKVAAYAETDAGRATCLGPERVRGIAADRAALFPSGNSAPTPAGDSGSVSSDADRGPSGRQPE